MPKRSAKHFDTKLFRFLRELSINNNREWFKANKDRYEREVRDPFLAFIKDVGPHLGKVSKQIVADPRPTGGSFFRIYRDTRFAKDKTPYKTHAAAQFRHAAGKDVHSPGVYLHLEPGNCFAAVGIWRPEGDSLRMIRDAIVANPKKYTSVTTRKTFTGAWSMRGDALKRPPKGFDPEHPLIDELKRKDFIAVTNFKQKEVSGAGFDAAFAKLVKTASPFCGFIAGALELDW